MRITDILWDTDGEETMPLPDEIKIPNAVIAGCNRDDAILKIADYVSDLTGFCIESFCIEYV